MAIIRTKRQRNFTVIDNCVYEDHTLSFAAMGLLSYLLSKPDNWNISVPALIKVTVGTAKNSRTDAIYALLKELIKNRFVIRQKLPNGEVNYFVYDEPQAVAAEDADDVAESQIGKIPNREKPTQAKSGKSLFGEIPDREKPDVLINTERLQQELNKDKQERIGDGVRTPCTTDDYADHGGFEADDEIWAISVQKNKAHKTTADPVNAKTWQVYSAAYFDRYGVLPVSNAKTRGQVAQLVKYVGREHAPALAAYFVQHNHSFFVQCRHDFGLLLKNYQQVLTDMQRNEQMTRTKAMQSEKNQSNFDVARRIIAQLQAEADDSGEM